MGCSWRYLRQQRHRHRRCFRHRHRSHHPSRYHPNTPPPHLVAQTTATAEQPDALNTAKPAFRVAEKLRDAGKEVVVVNPRAKEDVVASGQAVLSLTDCADPPIEVVDLIISPKV